MSSEAPPPARLTTAKSRLTYAWTMALNVVGVFDQGITIAWGAELIQALNAAGNPTSLNPNADRIVDSSAIDDARAEELVQQLIEATYGSVDYLIDPAGVRLGQKERLETRDKIRLVWDVFFEVVGGYIPSPSDRPSHAEFEARRWRFRIAADRLRLAVHAVERELMPPDTTVHAPPGSVHPPVVVHRPTPPPESR